MSRQAKIQAMSRKNNHRGKKGGSGIYTDTSSGTADDFEQFLSQCSFTLLSKGAYGITLLAKLNPSAPTPYRNLDNNYFGQEVREVVVKVSLIHRVQQEVPYGYEDDQAMRTVYEKDFIEEVNIQNDIYLKTMENLLPLCPAILFAGVFDNSNPLLSDLAAKVKSLPLRSMARAVKKRTDLKFGIIGMELAARYNTLHSEEQSLISKGFAAMERPRFYYYNALLRLAIETGYTQGDFHAGNVMVKDTIGPNGSLGYRVLILDFGMAQKLPDELMQKIKQFYDDKNYFQAIRSLCLIKRKDGYTFQNSGVYSVVCRPEMNRSFSTEQLFNERVQEARNNTDTLIASYVDRMAKRHEEDPVKFPSLPLDNSMREKMYKGFSREPPAARRSAMAPPSEMAEYLEKMASKIAPVWGTQFNRKKPYNSMYNFMRNLLYTKDTNALGDDYKDTDYSALDNFDKALSPGAKRFISEVMEKEEMLNEIILNPDTYENPTVVANELNVIAEGRDFTPFTPPPGWVKPKLPPAPAPAFPPVPRDDDDIEVTAGGQRRRRSRQRRSFRKHRGRTFRKRLRR